MGLLVEGRWQDRWYNTRRNGGRFVRTEAAFRRFIEDRPEAPFPVAADRYHLYVSTACPWCHRVLLMRALKGLQGVIAVSDVEPLMLDQGWSFSADYPEPLFGYQHAHQLYTRAKPDYSGRVTVPILWDKQGDTIVSNESSELIRMLDGPFARLAGPASPEQPWRHHRYAPDELLEEIDAVNARVYGAVNNGVYRAGFATTQAAYNEAVDELFDCLDWLEQRLDGQAALIGDRVTEADIRLLPTLLRFDAIYYGHFKCSRRQLRDYPNLWGYTRALYQLPPVAETFDLEYARTHYYGSHESINPTRIVPVGPVPDFLAPHDRPAFVWD